jgi:hypothetical protein
MSTEIVLLLILGSLTLIAYTIALNSHGPTRLSISYLLATCILIATVWATIQYVNSSDNRRKMEEFQKLMIEKQTAEAQKDSAMQWVKRDKARQTVSTRLNGIVTQGSAIATAIINLEMANPKYELDVLLGRASDTKKKAEDLAAEFDKLNIPDTVLTQSKSLTKEAIKQLMESAQYYVLYYRAEDSAQEELRERVMKQKATESQDLFQKATALIASSN